MARDTDAGATDYGRVASLFRGHGARVGGVVALVLVVAGLGIVNPLLIQVLFDDALFRAGGPDVDYGVRLIAIMVAIPLVSGALGVWQTWLATSVGQDVMTELRSDLYAHLRDLPLGFFTSTRTGEVQSRLTNDITGVQTVVTSTASTVLSTVVTVLSAVVAMFVLSWQLTVASLALVPVFVVLARRVGERRRAITRTAQESTATMTALTEETLSVSGVMLSKVFNRGADETARFREESQRYAATQVRREMVGQSFFAVVRTFLSISPVIVYAIALVLLARGGAGSAGISAGTIVAFTTLQGRLFFPVVQLLQVGVELRTSLAMFDRIFEYLDVEPDIVDRPGAVDVPRAEVVGEVRFEDVTFDYEPAAGHDSPALRDVDLVVPAGTMAAFVGPSGAGKSTLVSLVPRLYDVTDGAVRIDGRDVRDWTLSSLAESIGYVTQDSTLFHASIADNLRYGKPDATEDELREAVRAAQLLDTVEALPDGFDTVVGERGTRLSGGQRQRLSIARVILSDPRILILDEATSALDTESERLIQAALEPLMEGRTTLAIAHRLSTILTADRIHVVDGGRITQSGTHEELVMVPGRYQSLYREQYGSGRIEARCEDGVVLSDGTRIDTRVA